MKKKCEQVQGLLAESFEPDGSASDLVLDGEPIRIHVENCPDCSTWQKQAMDIVDMTRSLPQFDVSEGLTQSILRQVELEDGSKQQDLRWVVYAVAATMFLFLVLFVDAYESVWGIGSWIVGLVTMLGVKILIAEPKKERQVT